MRSIVALCLLSLMTTASAQDNSTVDTVNVGRIIYQQTCIACHGKNGKGVISGMRDLASMDGPLTKADEVLLQSVSNGYQLPSSPIAMPRKGGNPTLSESDIKAAIAYLRSEFGGSEEREAKLELKR